MNNYQKIDNFQNVQAVQGANGDYIPPMGQITQYMGSQGQPSEVLISNKDEGYDVEDSKDDDGKYLYIFLFW